jgi:hypothetical protein
MKRIVYLLAAAASVLCLAAIASQTSGQSDASVAPDFGITIPPGYRDWKLISVAHEEADLNDIRAILGNDVAEKAFREGTHPLPDGAIIARLAWTYVSSEENNKAFGRRQSFIAGAPTNVQFMVKDSTRYGATGGWGFAQFKDGKRDQKADLKTCFPCHTKNATEKDFVFTRYSP